MEFNVLGPLEVVADGSALELASRKQRILLGMLLVNPGETVSVDRLNEALWGEQLPDSVAKALQVHVHRLRRALGDADRVEHRHPGYALAVDPGELDIDRFDRLAERARKAQSGGDLGAASELCRRALALWRGHPFEGLTGVPAIGKAAVRLQERRLAIVEQRVDVELDLGRHGELSEELPRLVDEHPRRERLRAQLMLALYRTGRRREALDVFDRWQSELVVELGIAPGPELTAFAEEMRRGRVDGSGPARPTLGPPSQLPPDVPDFTGRREHVQSLMSLPARICTIDGLAGVGKTTLAVHVAHRLRPEFPDGQIYVNLRGAEPRPVAPGEVLARVLRALGTDGAEIPDDLDERAALCRSQLAGRRLLVVLDDAADEAQVAPLIPGSDEPALLITSRAPLWGLPGAFRVGLDVLGSAEAVELLARLTDAPSSRLQTLEEIVRVCSGLPLALRIASFRLASRPHWTLERLAERLRATSGLLDELSHREIAVRASFDLTYQSLQPRAARAFRLIGLLDAPDFPAWVAAAALDVPPAEAAELIDELVDAQLVTAAGSADAGERFRLHDLLRVYARERAESEDDPQERRSVIARVGGCLLALAEECHRREHGGDHHILHGSAPRWRLAPEAQEELLAFPLGWCERERLTLVSTICQAAQVGLDELAWDLATSCLTGFEARSYHDDWLTTHEEALAACRAAGNQRGEAVVSYDLACLALYQERYDDAAALCDRARTSFAAAGDERGGNLVQMILTYVECQRGHTDRSVALGRATAEAHRARHDLCAEAFTLCAVGLAQWMAGDAEAAIREFETSLAAYEDAGCRHGLTRTAFAIGQLQLHAGYPGEAERAFRTMLRSARATSNRRGQAGAHYGLGLALSRQDRATEAERNLKAAVEAGGETSYSLVERGARQALAAPQDHSLPAPRPGDPIPFW